MGGENTQCGVDSLTTITLMVEMKILCVFQSVEIYKNVTDPVRSQVFKFINRVSKAA